MRISDWSSDVCSSDLDLVALAPAAIAHVDRHAGRAADADLRGRQARRGQVEARIAEAEAEGVKRIGRIEEIAAPGAGLNIVEHRQLPCRTRDRHRQLAARIDVPEQHIRHGMAALLAQIPAFQNGVGLFRNLDGGGRTTVDEHHGDRLAQRLERSEEHTSELQSLMRISYAVFCLNKKKTTHKTKPTVHLIERYISTT